MTLTPREQQIAKVAGIVLGLVVIYYLAIEPLWTKLNDANTALAEEQITSIRNQGIFQQNMQATRNWNERYNKKLAKSLSGADTQLNDRIRQAAQSQNLDIQFDQSRSDSEKGFGRIMRPIQMTANMNKISRFVFQLQNSDIPIRINELTMSSKKDGTDDLTVVMNIATIYELPATSKPAGLGGR